MRIAIIAAGAGDMYCGSCLRDHATARGLRELGEDVTLVPTYTPLRLDGEPLSDSHVFLGGVEVFLTQKLPWTRARRGLLGRLLGSQRLLRRLARTSIKTDASRLGALTCSVLRGDDGNQRRLLEELATFLTDSVRPDIVHLPNSLLASCAGVLKRRLDVPVVCGLSGEDLFLAGLQEPHRSEALELLRQRSRDVDSFVAGSSHCRDHMAQWAGLDRDKIRVVLPGVDTDAFAAGAPASVENVPRPLTLGYLSRIAPEKGLHWLVSAFRNLCRSGDFPGLRLKIGGYMGADGVRYAAGLRRQLAEAGLGQRVELRGTLSWDQKRSFLHEIDLLSVPTDYPEPKGIFVIEALAAGVPVVVPGHGAFPELLQATGGGILHEPRSVSDLECQLSRLLRDDVERRTLADVGQKAVRERFTIARMAAETLEIYRELRGGMAVKTGRVPEEHGGS